MQASHPKRVRIQVWMYLLFVLFTSFFTYFYRYAQPQAVFWDEPYHIAAAQKYLNGVFFMEQHPPLGKLLIALGEKITHANPQSDQFIKTDYATGIGPEFSYAGYRLFPSLLGWLTAPLLFLIFLSITGQPAAAALLSFLYIFDNAEIVHSRGAMVDSPLTFFGMLTVLLFLLLLKRDKQDPYRFVLLSFLFGAAFGCAITTKLVGLIFALLVPALVIALLPHWRRILQFGFASLVGLVVTFVGVWQIHFSLASRVEPTLNNQGLYHASDEYKAILTEHKNALLSSFPVMMRDSVDFVPYYNQNVPRLDLCKPDENGSPSYFWPFGARTINYRWEQKGEETRYLFLVSNPVAWGLGLLGVILSVALLLASVLRQSVKPLKHRFLLLTFLALYGGYMITISQLHRVMYLYHYFLPLLFSFILLCLVLENIETVGRWPLTESRRLMLLTIAGLLIFAGFQFYRPLTYYEPLTDAAFARRAIVPLWELSCAHCRRESGLVVPSDHQP